MKNIIITGANGNLGSVVVKIFLKKNYKVIACISQRDNGLANPNTNVESFPLDLMDSQACKIFSETIIQKYQTIEAAVLTVGGFIGGNIDVATKDDFEKMFALNFITAFNIAQPVFKQMKTQSTGGKIIFIGSEPGRDGSKAKGSVAYGFTKSLLFRFAELINTEGKDKNISAHVIVPTTLDTPQNRTAMPDADFSKWTPPEKLAVEILNCLSENK